MTDLVPEEGPLEQFIEEVAAGFPALDREEALARLGQILHDHPSPAVREAAAYGLRGTFDTRVVEPLLTTFENRSEEPKVRGQAAEGIGSILELTDGRRRQFKRATRALIGGLRDESPEIRFWCAYALGVMRAKAALEELRRVAATDTAMCPRWWRVADEAADAITSIEGGSPPERTPVGLASAAEP